MSYSINNRNRETTGYRWKAYQAGIQLNKRRRQRSRTTVRLLITTCRHYPGRLWPVPVNQWFCTATASDAPGPRHAAAEREANAQDLLQDKQRARSLLDPRMLINLQEEGFSLVSSGKSLQVETSLDPALQRYMLKKMDRVNSRFIGIVAAEPVTGRVILLSGFNKQNPDLDPCLDNQYPAASIFKIVAAAAAVEQCGLTSDSKMRFNGYAHTLYKRQLKDVDNRYTNHITFRDSFAKSINPVFGKIGTLYLNKTQLKRYAQQFRFQPDN